MGRDIHGDIQTDLRHADYYETDYSGMRKAPLRWRLGLLLVLTAAVVLIVLAVLVVLNILA